jgi:hypothetical protein
MADHAHDVMLPASEVKTAVPSLGEASIFALKLGKQAGEGNAPGGENPEVPVHGKNEFVAGHGGRYTDRNGFLPHAAEPLADFPLAKLGHHFLLNHSGEQQLTKQLALGFLAQALGIEAKGVVREHFRHGVRR